MSKTTSLANSFIEGFTQEELTCSGLGNYWQTNIVENVCGSQDGEGGLPNNSANIMIILFILLFVETLLTCRGFVLSVKNYKHCGTNYMFGEDLANGKVIGGGQDEDDVTVDDAQELDGDD